MKHPPNSKETLLLSKLKHPKSLKPTTMSDHFPVELLSEILKRLSPKSLIRCTSVQKSWYNFIKTPHFITTHLNYQKTHTNYLLFDSFYSPSLSLRFDDLQCPDYYTLKRLPGMPTDFLHATSNGLICLLYTSFDYDSKIYLWNPSIQKFKTLPDPNTTVLANTRVRWFTLAFGFSHKANDFKVAKIVCYGEFAYEKRSTLVQVYSLSSNAWKNVSNNVITSYDVDMFDWVFVNGTAFFRGKAIDRRDIIVCFDTDKDVMRNISLPEQSEIVNCHRSLHEFEESLALFVKSSDCSNGLNMWVLKESGTNGNVCWEKKISISLDRSIDWRVLGLRNNGEVILRKTDEPTLASFNVESNETRDFVDSWDLWSFVKFDINSDPFGDDPPPFTVNPFVEGLFLINDE